MAYAPLPLVAGAPRVPLQFGLFSALNVRVGAAEPWEVGGVRWEELPSAPLGGLETVECEPGEGDVLELPRTGLPVRDSSTFSIYGHFNCSLVGKSLDEGYDMAVKHLEGREESRVERALWTGDLGNTPNFTSAENRGSFTGILYAVAALEQYFAETYGSAGVLHMNRESALIMYKQGKLEKRGGRLFTGLDTQVVAGTGYAPQQVVITPQLFAYRSEVFPGNHASEFFNTKNNDAISVAERTYTVGYDQTGVASANFQNPQ